MLEGVPEGELRMKRVLVPATVARALEISGGDQFSNYALRCAFRDPN